MLLRYVYILFVGLLVATFVGVGIAAFYKGPTPPDYSTYPYKSAPSASESAEIEREQAEQDREFKEFTKLDQNYNKNVSMIALAAAIIILVLSLTLVKQIQLISDGLLLGGVLTLLYSIVRGFSSNDDIFRFLVVSAGLIAALFIGYLKFVRAQSKHKN